MGLAPVVQRLGCAIHQLKLLPISYSFGGSVQEAVIANITKTTIFISTDIQVKCFTTEDGAIPRAATWW